MKTYTQYELYKELKKSISKDDAKESNELVNKRFVRVEDMKKKDTALMLYISAIIDDKDKIKDIQNINDELSQSNDKEDISLCIHCNCMTKTTPNGCCGKCLMVKELQSTDKEVK